MNKITFCLSDKPESFSFDFDYHTNSDDYITYGGVNKYTGLIINGFYSIENVIKQIDKFDLIVQRTFESNSMDLGIYLKTRIIYSEIIEINNVESFTSQKVKSLTIKPKNIWDIGNDEEFYNHLTRIRREIKLNKIGI
jgi:hypothetical protein